MKVTVNVFAEVDGDNTLARAKAKVIIRFRTKDNKKQVVQYYPRYVPPWKSNLRYYVTLQD